MNELITLDSASLLVGRLASNDQEIATYLQHYFKKIKTELCTHTQGKLFDKVLTVFNNEEPESSKFVLNTYESVTKGSIWRGIDNLSRIFNNTGFEVTGDVATIQKLNEADFFTKYVSDFISVSTAIDPNTVQVWVKNKQGDWVSHFVQTQFIVILNDDEIGFIVPEESEYDLTVDNALLGMMSNTYQRGKKVTQSFFEGVTYQWKEKIKYVYISKEQYIEIYRDGKEAEVVIENFKTPLNTPYTYTGVEKVEKGVYHSAMAGFIPFGNHALIQHRTYRSVEALFGYPRMSEIELPCDVCVAGEEAVDITDECPTGLRPCRKCGGTGHLSLQSPFKIYKRKLFPDNPELNANIKPVEFFTPDIAILNYNASAWKETLQMGEDAIYIQQRVETGNVESAKSREKQLESMYAWLGRISNVIYHNIQQALNNYALLTGAGEVTINKPISYAIMSELEAFDYLNKIVSTDAPVFIKTTHIENFLNRYISRTSPVIKIVEVLKRVDPFVFYTTKDMQTLSDSAVLADIDWKVHSYAFPLLMQMYSRNKELLEKENEAIEAELLRVMAEKFKPVIGLNDTGGADAGKLRGSVGGMYSMIQIAKAVANGEYDLDAAVALIMDRFGLSEEEARKQLGTPSAPVAQ